VSTSAEISGEQVLVHAAALIDQAIQPSVRSLGEIINISGLFASGVSIAVRRRMGIAAPDGQTAVNHPR
jgi:hypothetical protein